MVEATPARSPGAALRGGDLVVKGDVGARTGIDQKGGTIIVLGNAASMTGFMMQRGRQIICGDVGPASATRCTTARSTSAARSLLGIDCVEGEWGTPTPSWSSASSPSTASASPPELRKFVCGKKLYNYDNLEPSERKLVL